MGLIELTGLIEWDFVSIFWIMQSFLLEIYIDVAYL